jgi:hypothetical protein
LFSFLDAAEGRAEIPSVFRAVILFSKAIIRDQGLRRRCMFGLMGVAVVMLFLGSFAMSDQWARAHPALYFLYWAACAWLTMTAVLLALMDILMIRAAGRTARRVLERQFAEKNLKEPKP